MWLKTQCFVLPSAQPKHTDGTLCSSWLRVIVEKPFGKDLESSKSLAAELARWYPEEQVHGGCS